MKRFWILISLTAAWLPNASAWQPSGWVHLNWPWAYEDASQDWHLFQPDYSQWAYGYPPANGWQPMWQGDVASGWTLFDWPYAYAAGVGAWCWMPDQETQWTLNLRTGESSCFGHLNLVLYDAFTGSLADHWIPGRAANADDGIHALTIEDEALKWTQNYDYIESKEAFGKNLIIELGYRAGAGSVQKGEFWVELVALTESDPPHYTAGIYRSQYGVENYHAVGIGRSPSPADATVTSAILDSPHLATLAPGNPREGKITFLYARGRARMQFENTSSEIVATDWVDTGALARTRVRIWGMGTAGGPRFLDYVKIYAGTPPRGNDPVYTDGYRLVKIVEAGALAPFIDLDGEPTLNDAGTVAFWALEQDGNDGIFTGSGGELSTILHRSEPNMQDIWGYKSINNDGVVAVQLQYLENNTSIEARTPETRTTIISVEQSELTHLADPQINDAGSVAFWGQQWVVNEGVYQGVYRADPDGGVVSILDHTAGADFAVFAMKTTLNDAGEVAFAAKAEGGEYSLYKGSGADVTVIAGPGGQFAEVGGAQAECTINSSGRVAFLGAGDAPEFWTGVFSGDGETPLTEHVLASFDGARPFQFIRGPAAPALNDSGQIAFLANHEGLPAGNGLYAGPDPVDHKVIEAGDLLDGREVAVVSVGRHCLNAHGQIALLVTFADGSQAIYRADPL
jgi:hypothetical protein